MSPILTILVVMFEVVMKRLRDRVKQLEDDELFEQDEEWWYEVEFDGLEGG